MRARGVLTEAGDQGALAAARAASHGVRPALDELVAEGRLRRLRVDDGGADVLVAADAELDRPAPRTAVLLSPFDNLLWDRPFARRILGFDHLIEVYKPAPQRRYGYYVLPFLRGDRIVGRADLKSERQEGGSSSAPSTARTACARRARSTTRSTGRSTGSPVRSGSRRCVR